MNRRGFFSSLALLGSAAAVAPGVFIPKFEPVRWKVIHPPREVWYRLNPEYEKAPYELAFCYCYDPKLFGDEPKILQSIIPSTMAKPYTGWPMRFRDAAGMVPVDPFVEVLS